MIHFAAESHVDRSIQDCGPFVQTNVVGTQVLLDAARAAGVRRFVQVSTDEVYGSLGATGAFTEETPLAPNSPYAASKAAADLLVRSYAHTFDFPARYHALLEQLWPVPIPRKTDPAVHHQLDARRAGAGLWRRSASARLDSCSRPLRRGLSGLENRAAGEVYNIGGRCERTNLDLTYALLDAVGKPRSLIRHVMDRPGHDRRYAIDCSKIERELGWRPAFHSRKDLRETVQWYRDNMQWTNNVRSGEYLKYYERQYGK